MARQRGRTQPCSPTQARQRLERARAFRDVAELVADENDPEMELGSVAVSLAVLAGIAASDAACCMALGERSRSENHHDAEALLEQLTPHGKQAAQQLRQLLNLKNTAQYGFIAVTSAQLKQTLRRARALVDFADDVLRR